MTLRRQPQLGASKEAPLPKQALHEQGAYLVIRRDGRVLFERVRHARDFFSRLRGLLLTGPMQLDEGLLLSPCRQVHTIGMSYPIDIIFLDKTGCVLRCLSDVRPYRVVSTPGAAHTLEVAAGQINRFGIMPGQTLSWAAVGLPTVLQ